MTWMLFWKISFIICISLFFILAVWVSIGSIADIKSLLKKLKDDD